MFSAVEFLHREFFFALRAAVKKDASRPPCGYTTPSTMFPLIIFFFLTLLYWCE
jgi:hypothetical protein